MPDDLSDAKGSRRKAVWSIPSVVMAIATANNGVAWLRADERDGIVQVVTLLVGLLVGAVWQRFDARNVTARLAVFAVLLLLLALFTLVPQQGAHPYPLMAVIGLVAGVLLQSWWNDVRKREARTTTPAPSPR
jgi:FtsH-binding integral membrane protein